MWLHCHGAPGSHVIIQSERNKTVPLNSLMDAGLLAVHFSKLRGAEQADVVYTQRKYVRPVRGGPAGKVILERFKTLHIRSDPEGLKRILATARTPEPPERDGA
jgi:predicted ribosome quality control (RQC) complex YloA/Tae2 family protein